MHCSDVLTCAVPLLPGTVSYTMPPAGRTQQSVRGGWLHEWCASMGWRQEDQKLRQLSSQRVLGEKGRFNKEGEKAKGLGVSCQQRGR